MQAWFVCESLLNQKWSEWLDVKNREMMDETNPDKKDFINKDRRKLLLGRDFTASMKGEVLSLAGELPDRLYNEGNYVRGKRNRFAHFLEPVDHSSAQRALVLAEELFHEVLGLRVSAGGRKYRLH